MEVNAGVWAKEGLTVVAGRNRVSADGKTAASLAGDGSARPELAIDMGQMGGMYSGSIRMIGTEAGVGVRNRNGQVQAGKTLTVSSEGKLLWQAEAPDAATRAGGDIQLAAKGDIETRGKVYSGSQLAVQGREGMLTQSGTLAAAGNVQLNAARGIQSSGHLLAGSDAESTWSMMPTCSLIAVAIFAPVAVCSLKERQCDRAPGGYQRRAGRSRPYRADGTGWWRGIAPVHRRQR